MSVKDLRLLLVIFGLVLSTALLSGPPTEWSAIFSLLTFSVSLVGFSGWLHGRIPRGRSIFHAGGAVVFAATLWIEHVLTPIESPLRRLMAFAPAWMVVPLGTFALSSLSRRPSRKGP